MSTNINKTTIPVNHTQYNLAESLLYSSRSKTKTKNKFHFIGSLSDFWVIRTDYSNYSVAYGCTTQQQDGTCIKARAWVFSRRPTLADDLSQEADDQLEKLCLNLTSFLVTKQTNGNILAKEKFIWSNTGVYIKKNYRKVIEYTQRHTLNSIACVSDRSAIKSDFQTVFSTTVVALSRWTLYHNLHTRKKSYELI